MSRIVLLGITTNVVWRIRDDEVNSSFQVRPIDILCGFNQVLELVLEYTNGLVHFPVESCVCIIGFR